MAYYYADTDVAAGDDSGNSWTNAKGTLQEAITLASSGGDTVFFKNGSGTKDTAAGNRTLTSPRTTNETTVKIIGCLAATTNEGSSVVSSDFAVRTGTQPIFEITGAGGSLTFQGGDFFDFYYIDFIIDDRITVGRVVNMYQCTTTCDNWLLNGAGNLTMVDCETNIGNDADVGSGISLGTTGAIIEIHAGEINTVTSTTYVFRNGGTTECNMIGVDLSGCDVTSALWNGTGRSTVTNCKFPTETLNTGNIADNYGVTRVIGCNDNTSAKTNSESFQDYDKFDYAGLVIEEATVVRTGGGSDQATGTFSYAMTPNANHLTVGSSSKLSSPWLAVWVAGGSSTTLKMFITHNNADGDARDMYEDEISAEYYTMDNGDTTQATYTTIPAGGLQVAESTTAAGTDDTASTWATHNTYKRSFDTTLTPGYTGWVMGRINIKKLDATPNTVYLDPEIEVT